MESTSDLDPTARRSGEVRTREEEETAAAAEGEVRSSRSRAGSLAGGDGMEL